MAKTLKIYLDTSVPNALLDDKNVARKAITSAFWQKLIGYHVYISDLVEEEIGAVADLAKKNKLLKLIGGFDRLISRTQEINELANEYVLRGIIPVKHIEDAVHLALVSVNLIDVIVSWNFEHIVKLKTKREINVVNVFLGYPQVEIIDPEMF